MNEIENPEFSKSFYKIKEVAEFVDVPQSTLRFWEKKFPESIKPIRNTGRIRYYTPETIENLRLIKFLLYERGMKIEAVKDELRHNSKNVSRRMKILDKLESIRDELEQILDALEKRR